MRTSYANAYNANVQELFGLGMTVRLAVLGYMILICLGSLVHMLEYGEKLIGQRCQTS